MLSASNSYLRPLERDKSRERVINRVAHRFLALRSPAVAHSRALNMSPRFDLAIPPAFKFPFININSARSVAGRGVGVRCVTIVVSSGPSVRPSVLGAGEKRIVDGRDLSRSYGYLPR